MKPIILASASPRRRDLMAEAGIACEIVASPAEEIHDPGLSAGELTVTNAALKAEAVGVAHPDRPVGAERGVPGDCQAAQA